MFFTTVKMSENLIFIPQILEALIKTQHSKTSIINHVCIQWVNSENYRDSCRIYVCFPASETCFERKDSRGREKLQGEGTLVKQCYH